MKNISIYKFLLPLSITMLAIGAIILFLGWLPGSGLGSAAGLVCGGFLFFGFIFFVISLIDSSISRKRAVVAEQKISPIQKSHSVLKYVGIAIISFIIFFLWASLYFEYYAMGLEKLEYLNQQIFKR